MPTQNYRRGLYALFASTFFELTGLFMFGPLLIFMLKQGGLSDALIGLVTASQWLGMALAAPFSALCVRRIGLRSALIASAALPFFTLTAIALTPWPALWAALNLLGGMAGALRWIVSESTVAQLAPDRQRGRIVGWYQTTIGITFVLGPALLAVLGTDGASLDKARWLAVGLAGVGLGLSFGVPALAGAPAADPGHLGLRGALEAVRANPVMTAAGFIGGFFEAGLSGVLPLYGLASGFAPQAAALLVSASGLGSTLLMIPIGALADHWPQRSILLTCSAMSLAGSLLLPMVTGAGPMALLLAFVWGGAGGALYTLAMIDLGHRFQGVALVNATSVLVLSYTLGGMTAPALGGAALGYAPRWGFPLLLTAISVAGLCVMTFGHRDRGRPNPTDAPT